MSTSVGSVCVDTYVTCACRVNEVLTLDLYVTLSEKIGRPGSTVRQRCLSYCCDKGSLSNRCQLSPPAFQETRA